jgi:hypothetical protein
MPRYCVTGCDQLKILMRRGAGEIRGNLNGLSIMTVSNPPKERQKSLVELHRVIDEQCVAGALDGHEAS